MAPILRPRKRLNESLAQQANRMNVQNILSRWGKQQDRPLRSRGFRNRTGADCYFSSVLQALLHVPKFINWLDIGHQTCTAEPEDREGCVACALRTLSGRYWSPTRSTESVNAAAVTVQNRLRLAGWHDNGEQDAHELYQCLIGTLQAQLLSDTAVIEALFISTKSQTLICPNCLDQSPTNVTDSSIDIFFVHAAPLVDLIRRGGVFGSEMVFSRCTACNFESDRQQHKKIVTPPEILVLHICRFGSDRGNVRLRKDHIPFVERLDLSAYIDGKATLKYRLRAVIHHSGSLNSGHYITVARGPGGTWEEMNDHNVRSKGIRLADAVNPKNPWSPYLLFYERVGGEVVEAPTKVYDQEFWTARETELERARKNTKSTNRGSSKPAQVRRKRKDRR